MKRWYRLHRDGFRGCGEVVSGAFSESCNRKELESFICSLNCVVMMFAVMPAGLHAPSFTLPLFLSTYSIKWQFVRLGSKLDWGLACCTVYSSSSFFFRQSTDSYHCQILKYLSYCWQDNQKCNFLSSVLCVYRLTSYINVIFHISRDVLWMSETYFRLGWCLVDTDTVKIYSRITPFSPFFNVFICSLLHHSHFAYRWL